MQRGLVERSSATDERADDLAPFRVRQADNGDLGDAGVFQQAVLDLGREMVLATPDDHFLDPSRDGDVAARIHPAQIAGVEPTHASTVSDVALGLSLYSSMTQGPRAQISPTSPMATARLSSTLRIETSV